MARHHPSQILEHYGQQGFAREVPDANFPEILQAMLNASQRMESAANAIARNALSVNQIVDEYQPATLVPSINPTLTLIPQFERQWIRLEHIIITGPASGVQVSLQNESSVNAPAANTFIVQSLANNYIAGATYQVSWIVGLDGTVGTNDRDNFQLRLGGTTLDTSINPAAIGNFPQSPSVFTQTNPTANLSIRSGGNAATAGSVYTAQMEITPVNYGVTLQLGDRLWPLALPPTGILTIGAKGLILSRQDPRILTAQFPGQYSLELLGSAIDRD